MINKKSLCKVGLIFLACAYSTSAVAGPCTNANGLIFSIMHNSQGGVNFNCGNAILGSWKLGPLSNSYFDQGGNYPAQNCYAPQSSAVSAPTPSICSTVYVVCQPTSTGVNLTYTSSGSTFVISYGGGNSATLSCTNAPVVVS